MNKNQIILPVVTCAIILIALSCKRQQPEVYKNPENTFSVKGSVHELDLYPDPAPSFPEHEGKAEFISYCAICHSLKYITMQPGFSAKTWEAEVTKMVVKYHAPIDSLTCRKITGYLVAIKPEVGK